MSRTNDLEFYQSWTQLLLWMRDYAQQHEDVLFVKQSDFPDYIYRMERPYELPTSIMSATLSNSHDHPFLLVSASPRHTTFKEVTLHPFESHTYRTLSYNPEKGGLAEGKRVFTQEMLNSLADSLLRVGAAAE